MPAPRLTSWLLLAAFPAVVLGGLAALVLRQDDNGTAEQIAAEAPPFAGQPPPAASVSWFIDDSGRRTLTGIQALPPSAWRAPANQRRLQLNPSEVGWLRVTLCNASGRPQSGALVVGDHFQDVVEAWVPAGDTWRHERTGEKVWGAEKPWWSREAVIPVEVPAAAETTLYVRTTDEFDTTVSVVWWPAAAALHRVQVRQLLGEELYFGVLLALLAYNLVLWLRLRAPDIGWYVLNLGAIMVFMASARAIPAEFGLGFGSPGVETLVVCSAAASGFFLARFARFFLDLKTRAPRADRAARAAAWVMAALALGGLTTPWTSYVRWMVLTAAATVLTHALLLLIATRCWHAGIRQARFFILSFGCLFAGALPLALIWLFKSAGWHREAGLAGLMIGSACEMLLLSLAIADRFVQAQRERAAAQQELLEEAERRRAIQEAYADELETEVRERTRELESITADKDRMITVLGHDLRGPLTGLTQSAEQLAADPAPGGLRAFAADAAATGRQLLLLIEDLALWARLRSTGRQVTTCGLLALISPAVAVHRETAKHRGIELVVDAPETLRVATELVPAQTLVRNLVDNAVKHARQRVEIVAGAAGDAVRLHVRDDGPGLPADVAAWLANETGAAPEGRGLGLRLCAEISRAMGAHLESRPLPGGGTEFSIRLKPAPAAAGVT
ncbi:MAG TPA: sensor histidine kinase [Opitutus sp.]|nr:sensor histidine kinase [Opitutus sp.]